MSKQSTNKAVARTVVQTTKNTFSNLFIILVIVLMVLPLWATFNEFLTRFVENFYLFGPIQKVVVPYEVMLVRTIISFFGIQTQAGTVAIVRDGVPQGTFISWNCVGWQSFVILLISLKAGFAEGFTKASKLQALVLALLGTFFMNLARISLVIIILYYFGKSPSAIIHDYLSIAITIIWLFFFWWFSYSFVLETKDAGY